ncbi:hypothetical protein D3C81_1746180 [compost metagenome]
MKTGYIPGQPLDLAFQLSDLLGLALVDHHQLLDVLPRLGKVVLQLLILSLEQESVLLEHLHGRGHAQRKAVVVDDHDATF